MAYRWLAPALAVSLLATASEAEPLPAQLRDASRSYLETGSDSARARLASAIGGLPSAQRTQASLALGVGDFQAKKYEDAVRSLEPAAADPSLGDYALYYRARAFAYAEDFASAAWVLRTFQNDYPQSPLLRDANRLRAESLIRQQELRMAESVLEDKSLKLSEPARLYLLGRLRDLDGKNAEAVELYRRAYYFYPFSEDAKQAEERLDELRGRMGSAYPEAAIEWRLKRADALFTGARYGDAAQEYGFAIPGLRGKERERAQVRQGAANYRQVHTTSAYSELVNLKVSDPELDAERIYFLGECARRKKQISEFERRAEELKAKYPQSPWYEEALFSLGNYYLLENDTAKYRAYYERAAREFPKGSFADKAHWKVCWRAYLDGDPRTRSLLEEHVRLYPDSDQASAALYWLARLVEKDGDSATALGLYDTIVRRFPNYYYSLLAEQRLNAAGAAGGLQGHWRTLTASLPGPRQLAATPGPQTRRLIDRGRTLFELGLDDLAERELATGDYRQPDGYWVGLELGRQAAARDDYFRGLRHMKRYGFGYLRMPLDSVNREFWELLYPLPYADALEARAKPHEVDPYLVAGLIRQESEFNPKAVSRAGAMGLMQVMPAVGRELARRLGVSGYSTPRLHEPDISLRFGVFHLKEALQQFQNNLELTLAAYNAGPSRARTWLTWGDFHEPGEFVETIPFTETRGYVQSVLRNSEMYRKLYGGGPLRSTTPSRREVERAAGN
ncbi:MAG: transglycosylase SLT domain-containing protein [Acidobacteria bacterium]|nr:transglycosylase SLT domain-containing protein [Acidobacteriota bacterium]